MSSARMLNLAPRCTAASPAATPAAPSKVATHRAVVTTAADTCTDCTTHGGPMAGMTTGGQNQTPRTPEAANINRIERPRHVAVHQGGTRRRAAPGPTRPPAARAQGGPPPGGPGTPPLAPPRA